MPNYYLIYTFNDNLFITESAKTALTWLLDKYAPQLAQKGYEDRGYPILEQEFGKDFDIILKRWDEKTIVENLEEIENWFDVYIDKVEGEE